ncbi:TPA: FKBP-type peptidyl-prolyl cis-trans isomerase [Vibrio vulnificus]|uniref:FKBP-type peptidyl-prolyl cis-trans isomerase n=1 Tax=Vibrio vulnificus TaxID=672 RepID=UPI00071ECCF4|nr:FKBP-type peptidyl-prolyl cis-trans isomerase [Vibrio vulnificus]ALM69700.1 FKBP-type peptidyl-prolyl cis-trans isomerase FkpA precursor [Vibrio vulnificus]ANH64495.1 FKBP-type peptidyl-prolyl cis-trans isomerase FkpA precursor [Vibrio vulnificus]ANN25307.1 FKBP-type peptidyl-prolyl cis-trans isomerase FkpA precursor [Vibrio vulnificus]EGR0049510.1 FKBP-type peptidyl-prolyl cis-trans isomerase [Vibrio vulnificus]MCU8133063.1 FKBP-type peptidyl-prolyl cis-trans isomerase [Vibrio vulnificus]
MKSVLKVSLLAATVMLAVGCQKEEAKPAAAPQAEQVQAETGKAVHFKSEDDKAAYAIGVSFANYLSASLDKPSEIGINLNKDLVLKGIEHVFAGNPELNEEETRAALEALDKRVAETMQKKAAEKAEAAKKAGDDFRAEFEKQEGVVKTDTGLLYQVITPAEGEKPKDTDTVQVHYKGTLTDGTQFDSSYDRGEPATFPLNRVIPGWTEGVQLMPVGSKFKFVIPPELAYGAQDTPSIPANSTLVFEVELLKIENGDNAQ